MYQFKYLLNDDDYLEFNKYHLSHATANKKSMNKLRILPPAIFILFLLLSFIDMESFDINIFIGQLVIYAIVSILWVFLVKPFYIFILKIHIKTIKKHGKLPYSKDIMMIFEEDSFIEITSKTETKIKYDGIEKIDGGAYAIYIYLNAMQAYIIPLYVFESEKHRDEFWQFIHCKWNMAKAIATDREIC